MSYRKFYLARCLTWFSLCVLFGWTSISISSFLRLVTWITREDNTVGFTGLHSGKKGLSLILMNNYKLPNANNSTCFQINNNVCRLTLLHYDVNMYCSILVHLA